MHNELIVNLCSVKVPVQKSRCNPKFEIELLKKFKNIFSEVWATWNPLLQASFGDLEFYFMQQSQVRLPFLCIIHTTGNDSCTVILEKY